MKERVQEDILTAKDRILSEVEKALKSLDGNSYPKVKLVVEGYVCVLKSLPSDSADANNNIRSALSVWDSNIDPSTKQTSGASIRALVQDPKRAEPLISERYIAEANKAISECNPQIS